MLPDIIPWTTISNTVSNFPVSEIILWSYLPSITYLHCKLKEEKWLLEHAVAANSIKARPFFSLLAKAFLFHRGPPQGFLWYKPLAGHPRSSQNGISRSKKSHILRAGQGSGKVIWRGVSMPPAIEPAHPYSLGLLITLVGRMLPFSLSIFFNWSSPDHLWSSWSSWSRLWWSLKRFNLLACDRVLAHCLQSSSSCSGWWSFEISGLPTKMIGSRRLFLPRSLGHIQLCSQVKRSFKCTVNPLMFELQGSKIWTIWPKWQPGTNWFGAFSKWKQVDWTKKYCWFDVYARVKFEGSNTSIFWHIGCLADKVNPGSDLIMSIRFLTIPIILDLYAYN